MPADTTVVCNVTFTPSSYEVIEAQLIITFLGAEGPDTTNVSLSGEGVTPPEIAITPSQLNSPPLYTESAFQDTLTIYNNGGYRLDVILWGGSPDWAIISTSVGSIPPGDSLIIDVTFDASGYCEDQNAILMFRSNDPENESVEIPISLTVLPGSYLVADPQNIDFGSIPITGIPTEPITRTLNVMNLGCEGQRLTVTNIESSLPSVFSVSPDSFFVDPGQTQEVIVQLLPFSPLGNYDEKLTIYSDCDYPNNPVSIIVLAVLYNPEPGEEDESIIAEPIITESIGPISLDLRTCPNPFNPSTEIRFNLDRPGRVELRIYDVRGALINSIGRSISSAGPVSVLWNGSNRRGSKVASGIYFYRLLLDGHQLGETKKMILLR